MKHIPILLITTSILLSSFAAASPPGAVLLTPERLDLLRQRIAARTEPTASAWAAVRKNATAALTFEPQVPEVWFVPGFYGNKEGHVKAKAGLQESADAAYALALAWQMIRDERYARASAKIILAWAGLKELKKENDSSLSFSYHFPPLIFAAALLRDSPVWADADEQTFRTFLREKALPLNTMDRNNNWGNWGLVLFSAIAAYNGDIDGLDVAEARWKKFIGSQIAADGHMHDEVGRNSGSSGMWYSHFSLFPQTISGEILRVQGRDPFEFTGKDGRSLKLAYERIAPWSLHPETFPYFKGDPKDLQGSDYVSYFEILLPRWPNADAQALVQALRPMTARHGLPYLTFTHGEPPAGRKP